MEDRRTFLKTAGGALLAASAAYGAVEPGPFKTRTYTIGLVFDPSLPGLSGQLLLNVYLAVAEDGTGLGAISDPLHPIVNSHIAIDRSDRDGNRLRFDGEVIRSNDPARVGLSVEIIATVHGDSASQLDVVLGEETFSGQGLVQRGVSIISPRD